MLVELVTINNGEEMSSNGDLLCSLGSLASLGASSGLIQDGISSSAGGILNLLAPPFGIVVRT